MITTNLHKAVETLMKGELVAIPTETVYGLAANANDDEALRKIYALKNRPFYNPLILHIHSLKQLQTVAAEIPNTAFKLAQAFWPGPLTLVLKKQAGISNVVTSGKDTVAVRIPDHPLTLELLSLLDFPLAAPSANPFGQISPTSAKHVYDYFGETIEVILDGGECQKGIESTIVGFENDIPVLYRLGSVSLDDIQRVVGEVLVYNQESSGNEIKSPGMLASHYAPRTTTYLTQDVDAALNLYPDKKIGLLLFQNTFENTKVSAREVLSINGDFEEAARNLYAAMHRLDHLSLDVIIAQELPNIGLGKSINDRLTRASKKI
jgi:L-threonylcarbamoyladenylate synthase